MAESYRTQIYLAIFSVDKCFDDGAHSGYLSDGVFYCVVCFDEYEVAPPNQDGAITKQGLNNQLVQS